MLYKSRAAVSSDMYLGERHLPVVSGMSFLEMPASEGKLGYVRSARVKKNTRDGEHYAGLRE